MAKEANLKRFVRTLVGLDRAAAKKAFGKYLDKKPSPPTKSSL